MQLKSLFVSAALCLSMMITGAHQGAAQQVQALEPEWLLQMYQEGWQKVQEGVLQRSGEGSSVETFTYGEDGLLFSIQKLEGRVALLENEYNTAPTEELGQALDQVQGQLLEAQSQVGTVEAEPFGGGDELQSCELSYSAQASATYLTGSGPGVTAQADAYFHSNCGHIGHTDAYAYSKASTGTTETIKVQQDPKNDGSWLDSYATSSVSGNQSCYSWSYGRSWSYQLGFDYYVEALANYTCPNPVAPPVISGPTEAHTDFRFVPCATLTWTVNTTSGYTYNWYIGSTHQGTGSSLSKTYCGQNATVNLTVVRSDNTQDTHTTIVSHYDGGDRCGGGGGGYSSGTDMCAADSGPE